MCEPADGLTERLALDVHAAFPALLDRHGADVYSTALRLSGSAVEAEELAQETFLRAYVALRKYAPERVAALRVRPWLYRITVNLWRNQLRDRARRPTVTSIERHVGLAADTETPEELTQRRSRERDLAGLVLALPPLYRTPVVLRHVAGLSYEEVARTLRCPVGTVKAQVSRGTQMLRRSLSEREEAALQELVAP